MPSGASPTLAVATKYGSQRDPDPVLGSNGCQKRAPITRGKEEVSMTRVRRLLLTALVPAMVLVAATTASAFGSPQGKVDVCHRTGNGSFHEINISGNALTAHLRHGDVMPDEYGDCP